MFTLVPSAFFDPASERKALSEVVELSEKQIVKHLDISQYDAVLVYAVDEDSSVELPEIYHILERLPQCLEYNKILCSLKDGILNIAVAQGKTLMLANWYKASDFTTAQYYIFLVMRSLQLNPEVSTISWLSPLDTVDEMSLYRYFKAVDKLIL